MTIRDHIQQRIIKFIWVGIFGAGCLLVSASVEAPNLKLFFKALGGVAAFASVIGFNFLLKCPRCSGNLARTQMQGQSKANFCPNCGVSLDDHA